MKEPDDQPTSPDLRGKMSPMTDVLPRLAKVLGVRVEDLLNVEREPVRQAAPAGRMRKLFDDVARLPRRQREKVVEVLSALVMQYRKSAG